MIRLRLQYSLCATVLMSINRATIKWRRAYENQRQEAEIPFIFCLLVSPVRFDKFVARQLITHIHSMPWMIHLCSESIWTVRIVGHPPSSYSPRNRTCMSLLAGRKRGGGGVWRAHARTQISEPYPTQISLAMVSISRRLSIHWSDYQTGWLLVFSRLLDIGCQLGIARPEYHTTEIRLVDLRSMSIETTMSILV